MSEGGPTVRVDLILFSLNSKYKSRPKNISFIDRCYSHTLFKELQNIIVLHASFFCEDGILKR